MRYLHYNTVNLSFFSHCIVLVINKMNNSLGIIYRTYNNTLCKYEFNKRIKRYKNYFCDPNSTDLLEILKWITCC